MAIRISLVGWRVSRMHKLTALAVKNAGPGRHGDGGCLWLQVGPTGTKAWLFRYMIEGRARAMGLGSAETFSLKEARERAKRPKAVALYRRQRPPHRHQKFGT